MKRKLLSLILAAAAVTACGDDNNGPQGQGRLRIVHLSPDAPPVDVVLDGDTVLTNTPYRAASDYLDASAGGHTLQISEAGTTNTLLDEDVSVADGTDYTVLVADTLADLEAITLTDDNDPPPSGKIKVRAIQGAPSAPPAVDIYVTDPGADLTNATPVATDVEFGDVSPYIDADAGSFQVRVTRAGTKDVLIDSGALTLESGQVRTAIAVDAEGGGAPFDLLVLADRD
jgi:hypothetical protein